MKSMTFKRLPRGKNGGVQLLLIQSVDHLGRQGDIVEVKRGYALNYLLPQGLATIASDHHKRMVEKHRAKLQEIEKARLSTLRQLADAISKESINVEAKVNEEGHLYGSVGPYDIAAALKQRGYHITSDQVRLEGQLKVIDLYEVKIHLHAEIEAVVKVWVVPDETSEAVTKKDVAAQGKKPEEAKPADAKK